MATNFLSRFPNVPGRYGPSWYWCKCTLTFFRPNRLDRWLSFVFKILHSHNFFLCRMTNANCKAVFSTDSIQKMSVRIYRGSTDFVTKVASRSAKRAENWSVTIVNLCETDFTKTTDNRTITLITTLSFAILRIGLVARPVHQVDFVRPKIAVFWIKWCIRARDGFKKMWPGYNSANGFSWTLA